MSEEVNPVISEMQDLSSRPMQENNVWSLHDVMKAVNSNSSASVGSDASFMNFIPPITNNSTETLNSYFIDHYNNNNIHPPSSVNHGQHIINKNERFQGYNHMNDHNQYINNGNKEINKTFKGFKCDTCNLVFLLSQDIKRHKEIRHNTPKFNHNQQTKNETENVIKIIKTDKSDKEIKIMNPFKEIDEKIFKISNGNNQSNQNSNAFQ